MGEEDQLATSIPGLLQACTVRVVVNGESSGAGFFVAPNTIVTCAHVVEAAAFAKAGAAPVIEAFFAGDTHPVEDGGRWPDEATDLAILRLTTPVEHPCVLLEASVRERDELDVFGFTRKYQDGVPASVTVEGVMGAPLGWLKLATGQIEPGMSGGAAVNARTGGVCGVVKRTRNPTVDLGGYAIPLSTLFRVAPQLEGENARFHARDRRWEDLLPTDARRLRRMAQGARPVEDAPATHLVVSVGQTASGWEVVADVTPGGTTIGPVAIDLNAVRQKVARLFRDWASRGRMQQLQEGGEIALLGQILFQAVIPDPIATRFRALRTADARLAVALHFADGTDSDLIELPWEHVCDEDARGRGVYLAREAGTTFSRVLERTPQDADPPTQRTLRVLVAAVRPQWDGDAGTQALAAVQEVVGQLERISQARQNVDVTVMAEDAPDADAIAGLLPAFDVLHYVGFGRFTADGDGIALGGDAASGIEYVPTAELAAAFAGAAPRLVVLQILEGQASELPADFSVLAPRLMQAVTAIPAVVAAQYPIPTARLTRFNETLYEQLARGAAVDVAVQEARSKVAWGRPSVSPALFLRRPGSLRLVVPGRDPSPETTGAFPTYA